MDGNMYNETLVFLIRVVVCVIEIGFALLLCTKKFQKLKIAIGIAFSITAVVGLLSSAIVLAVPDKYEDIPAKALEVVDTTEGYLVLGTRVTNPGLLKQMVTSSPTTKTVLMKIANETELTTVVKELQK